MPGEHGLGGEYEALRALYPWLPHPACGPGWHGLVEKICEDLVLLLPPQQLRDLSILEIGEAAGRLRIRLQGAGAFEAQVMALLREAEQASGRICQQCGAPGRRAQRGGWWATLCDEHARQGMWL